VEDPPQHKLILEDNMSDSSNYNFVISETEPAWLKTELAEA